MKKDDNWFEDILVKIMEDSNINIDANNPDQMSKLNASIEQMIPELTKVLLHSLKENSADMIEEHRLLRQEFEARLLRRWSKPINLLEMLVVMNVELGEDYTNRFHKEPQQSSNYVIQVLIRIHSRSCQIAYEILALLRSGFADGAFARWRTLHELATIATFIQRHGNNVALKYLEYENIENYKEAEEYQKKCSDMNYEPLDQNKVDIEISKKNELILKYGIDFEKPYGWVGDLLPRRKRNFRGIEEETKLDNLRPFYKLACNNIHSGPKGNNFSLALFDKDRADILPCGVSNYGLSYPGQNTAISLIQVVTCLSSANPTYENIITIESMILLNKEIGMLFAKVQNQIEEEELNQKDESV